MPAVSLMLDTRELAELYEQQSADRQFKAGQVLVDELGTREGEAVLDIGCGTGLLAAYVADRVGPTGNVHGIDPLPLRIEVARQKARHNLHFAVGNAYDLGAFASGEFDVVYLNAVFHWLPEKREPLRQIARVLKSGGRVGISTGSRDQPNPLHVIKAEVLSRAPYNAYPEAAEGGPQRVTATELEVLLHEAGFDGVKVLARPHARVHPSAAAAIEFSDASSFGNFLGHLPEGLRGAARRDIEEAAERLRTPEGIRQTGERLVAVAVKP
jgi:ubiquinone/menaquinone biosynthesis C-methylase UbiE